MSGWIIDSFKVKSLYFRDIWILDFYIQKLHNIKKFLIMTKIRFTKENPENIEDLQKRFRDFFARAYQNNATVIVTGASGKNHEQDLSQMKHRYDSRYVITQKFGENNEPLNYIMQIVPTGHETTDYTGDSSIWMDDGSDITFFDDNRIEIMRDYHKTTLHY